MHLVEAWKYGLKIDIYIRIIFFLMLWFIKQSTELGNQSLFFRDSYLGSKEKTRVGIKNAPKYFSKLSF